jgi:hypothetical protein
VHQASATTEQNYDPSLSISQQDKAVIFFISPALATAVIGCSLLPATIISSWIPTHEVWLFSWLTDGLIITFWNYFFLFNHTQLYCILPFIYFYIESDPTNTSTYGMVKQCVLVLCFIYGLLFSLVYVLQSSAYLSLDTTFLVTLTTFSTVVIALAALRATPTGYMELWDAIFRQGIMFISQRSLHRNLQQLIFEHNVLSVKLANLREKKVETIELLDKNRSDSLCARFYRDKGDLCLYRESEETKRYMRLCQVFREIRKAIQMTKNRIQLLRKAQDKILEKLQVTPVVRSLRCAIFLATHIIIWSAFIFHLILSFLNGIFKQPGEAGPSVSALIASFFGLRKDVEEVINSVLQVVLILYFMTCLILGCYRMPVLRAALPGSSNSSLQSILLNLAFCLVLSKAAPLMLRLLGLQANLHVYRSARHPYFFLDTWLSQNSLLLVLYRFCFLMSMTIHLFSRVAAMLY